MTECRLKINIILLANVTSSEEVMRGYNALKIGEAKLSTADNEKFKKPIR